jgi:hypothetical protein
MGCKNVKTSLQKIDKHCKWRCSEQLSDSLRISLIATGKTSLAQTVLQHIHAQVPQLQNLVLVCDGTHFTNNFWRCVHSALVQELQEGLNGEAGEVLDHHLAKPPKNKIEPCRNEVSVIS